MGLFSALSVAILPWKGLSFASFLLPTVLALAYHFFYEVIEEVGFLMSSLGKNKPHS